MSLSIGLRFTRKTCFGRGMELLKWIGASEQEKKGGAPLPLPQLVSLVSSVVVVVLETDTHAAHLSDENKHDACSSNNIFGLVHILRFALRVFCRQGVCAVVC